MKHPTFLLFIFSISLFSSLSLPVFASSDNFRMRAHQAAVNENTEADVEAEISFGKSIAARILGQYEVIKDKELIKYVNLVGKSLALSSSRSDLDFYFTVLEADFINAYSTPGGYVFITRGAIAAMKNEAELAAVLAHEVAHISEKHIVKEFKIQGKEDGATAGLSALLGSSSSSTKVAFSQAVDNAVNMLLSEGFKHAEEIESDQVAMMLMATVGYNPLSLTDYLRRIKDAGNRTKSSNHKPTHPATDKRVNELMEFARLEGLDTMQLARGTSRFNTYVAAK